MPIDDLSQDLADAYPLFGGFASSEVMAKGGLNVLPHAGGPQFFHEALRIGDRAGSALENGSRQFLHLGFELSRRNDAIDQADLSGAFGIEQFGREKDFPEVAFAELAAHEGHDKAGNETAP